MPMVMMVPPVSIMFLCYHSNSCGTTHAPHPTHTIITLYVLDTAPLAQLSPVVMGCPTEPTEPPRFRWHPHAGREESPKVRPGAQGRSRGGRRTSRGSRG